MNIAELITTSVPALAVIVAALYGLGRWMGKIEQNTAATEKLSNAFEEHAEKIATKVEDHEVRIRLVEHDLKQTRLYP